MLKRYEKGNWITLLKYYFTFIGEVAPMGTININKDFVGLAIDFMKY